MLNIAGGAADLVHGGYVHSYNDGVGSDASFDMPHDIAVDTAGNILVADGSNAIRKITPTGDSIRLH